MLLECLFLLVIQSVRYQSCALKSTVPFFGNGGIESECHKEPLLLHDQVPLLNPPFPVQDITDEMISYHKAFTDSHGLNSFTSNATARSEALRWCNIQYHAMCDLVYPLNVALNAAKAPAFIPMKQIVQFWYNQRQNYNPKKSFLENLYQAQQGQYEVLGFANIIAMREGHQMGCCRVPCKDDISMVYGCVYTPHGAGYWKISEDLSGRQGFSFFVPPQLIGENRLPLAKTYSIISLAYQDLITSGCSSHVPGSGPKTVLSPWTYSCAVQMENIADAEALDNQQRNFFFASLPVVSANCSIEKEALLRYKKMITSEIINKELFTAYDAGESVCGKVVSEHSGIETGAFILFYIALSGTSSEDILKAQKCASVYETFLDCGKNKRECFSRLITPSPMNPWIVGDMIENSAHQGLPPKLFILKNTFCVASSLSVEILPLKKPLGRIGLLGAYLNPSNFMAFNIDVSNGVAHLICCCQGVCFHSEPAFLGDTKNMALKVELTSHHHGTPQFKGKVNGETIVWLNGCNEAISTVGSSGLALADDTELHFIEKIQVHPIFSTVSDTSNDSFMALTNSFLPLWNLGRIENRTLIIQLIKKM